MMLLVISAVLGLAGLGMSQTVYKVPKRPGRGWSDGSIGGGYVKPDPNYKPARTPDGQPDIQGIWSAATTSADQSVEAYPGDGGRQFRKTDSVVVDPPDGKIPYKPWARAKSQDLIAHYIDPQATCLPVGMPRLMYYLNYEIVQVPGEVAIMSELIQDFRHIYLDGRPKLGKDLKLFLGDARGHWDGNTLTTDVTNLNDRTWFSVFGDFHSDKLHITERFTPIDPDTIQYEATIEDPVVYERPWKIAFPLLRDMNKKYEIFEEYCAEGNKSTDLQLEAGRKLWIGLDGVN